MKNRNAKAFLFFDKIKKNDIIIVVIL